MNEPQMPKFEWVQAVKAVINLFNDGTFPGVELNALLISSGTPGEIVNIGAVEATGKILYLVEFTSGQVIGVFENEIACV